MFVYYENEWYLVGIVTNVSPAISTSKAVFGSFDEASLTYNDSGVPNGVDTSALAENSLSIAVDMSDYIETISGIISKNPMIPEPNTTAGFFAITSILSVFFIRRRK